MPDVLLQEEVNVVIRQLDNLSEGLKSERMRILTLAGAYGAAGVESAAPRGSKTHYRYSTAKITRKIRAPKGKGRIVATYRPGNLQNSIRVLKFRRSKSAVFIGARLAKGESPSGTFGTGARADGYYAHMIEGGTKHSSARPFFQRGWNSAQGQVLRTVKSEVARVVGRFKTQTSL